MTHPQKKVSLFLLLTAAFSSVFYALLISAGTMEGENGMYVLGLMWCPGVAAIITQLYFHRSLRGMGWGWGKTKYQVWSYVVPIGYAAIAYGVVWGLGLGGFPNSGRVAWTAQRLGIEGYSEGAIIVIRFFYIAALGFLPSVLSAAGEEIGWRGLLVPELSKITSFGRTALISGAVWAAWHSPIIIFVDYNNPGVPMWYSLACFVVMVMAVSFLFAWLRLTSGSLWTGVILHASHNAFIQGFFTPMTQDTGITHYFIDEFGIALPIVLIVIALVVWKRYSGGSPIEMVPGRAGE